MRCEEELSEPLALEAMGETPPPGLGQPERGQGLLNQKELQHRIETTLVHLLSLKPRPPHERPSTGTATTTTPFPVS